MLTPQPTYDPRRAMFVPRKYGQPTPAAPMPQAPQAPQPPVRSVLKKGGDLAKLELRIPDHPRWYRPNPLELQELEMRRRGMLPDPEPLPDEVDPADLDDPVIEGVPPLPRSNPGQFAPPGDPEDRPAPGLFRRDREPEPEEDRDYGFPELPEWMKTVKRQPVPLPDPRNYQPGLQGLLG